MKMNNKINVIFKSVVLCVILLFVSLSFCSCASTRQGIEYYEEVINSSTFYNPNLFPSLDSLGDYIDIDFTEKTSSDLLSTSYGYALFVTYEQDDYEAKTNKENEAHAYLNENNAGFYCRLPLAEINYKGYEIKIVPFFEYDFSCKNFGMIGFNDEKCRICYMTFLDTDIDTLGISKDPVSGYIDFIDKYFIFID